MGGPGGIGLIPEDLDRIENALTGVENAVKDFSRKSSQLAGWMIVLAIAMVILTVVQIAQG